MILKFNSILLFVLVCVSTASAQQKPQGYNITNTFITLKSVTTNSHAATLVEIKPNEIMAAWFGGSYEGAKDVGIYFSTYKNKIWSQPQNLIKPLVKQSDTLACWNPVLFRAKSNRRRDYSI